jgi:arylsulfatase
MRVSKRRVLILSVLGLLAGLGFLLARPLGRPAHTNLILITVDTLRADHLGVYGYPKSTSPKLDRFATESWLFRRAYAHVPATTPSLSVLMTSHYAHETRVPTNHYRLPEKAVTLAEILKAGGYRTGAVVGNLTLKRDAALDQGFEDYDDRLEDDTPMGVERKAEQNTKVALAWLERHQREKFFLWVHYMDPHGPYLPPPPYDGMFVAKGEGKSRTLPVNKGLSGTGGISEYQVLGDHRDPEYYIAQYDGEIRYCDYWLGELLEAIRRLGLFENTLIVFTADHGEGLGEHDYYFDHTDYLYEELLHVPLLIRFPGSAGEHREIARTVGQIELLPAVLRRLSVASSEQFEGSGSLAEGPETPIYAETFYRTPQWTLFTPGLKLIRSKETFELYDRAADPGEQRNILDSNMEPVLMSEVARLKEKLGALMGQDRLALGAPTLRQMSEEIRRKFRSLGYVQ